MALKIVGGLVVTVLLAFLAGFVLPSQIHVERSILISAQPADIFPLVSDFRRWDAWSPWAKRDPNAEMTITGTGVGQTMRWQSDDPEVGIGTQEISQLQPPNQVITHLNFGDQGVADATFKLLPQGQGTQVYWMLDSDVREGVPLWQKPISTYFGFLMDRMVGQEYEKGLDNLKALVES